MNKHINNGSCAKCKDIINRYPNFFQYLSDWFVALQKELPEAHVSWAGRGKADQELFFSRGFSRAHYGQSSHNFNAAIDLFRLTNNGASFDSPWYRDQVGPKVLTDAKLNWYGAPGSQFFELPHVEFRDWKALVASGQLKLVEPL